MLFDYFDISCKYSNFPYKYKIPNQTYGSSDISRDAAIMQCI